MTKLFVIGLLLVCGCEYRDSDGCLTTNDSDFSQYSINTVSHNNEKHEYLTYRSGHAFGLTHLPNCKYCKQKEQ